MELDIFHSDFENTRYKFRRLNPLGEDMYLRPDGTVEKDIDKIRNDAFDKAIHYIKNNTYQTNTISIVYRDDLLKELFDYTKNNLTTKSLAEYVLTKSL